MTLAQKLFNIPDVNNQDNVRKIGELVLNNPEGLDTLLSVLISESLTEITNAGEGELGNFQIRKAQDQIQAYENVMERAKKYSIQAKEFIQTLDNNNK